MEVSTIIKVKTVGITSRLDLKKAAELVESIIGHLLTKSVDVKVESRLRIHGVNVERIPLNNMRADMIITVGGDGTVLRTCSMIPIPETPLLTVNMGTRGFLTETNPEGVFEAIDLCFNNKFKLDRCMKLSSSSAKWSYPDALNEVFITSRQQGKVVGVRASKNDVPVMECYSDGLIVATPTGSTAHSLSSGGPVIDPEMEAMILTPVCSSTPTHPIVVPSDAELSISLLKSRGAKIFTDGSFRGTLRSRDKIRIRRSKHQACFIRFKDEFYKRLENRLFFPIRELI